MFKRKLRQWIKIKLFFFCLFFCLYHKLLQHSFSKHIKQADFWKIKNNRKTNTKKVFSFHLQYYMTWLCQAMDVCVLPCVKSSLFATSEDLQGDLWFWFAHSWKTTTSSGKMLFTAQTKLLTQEFPWSYTLLLKQLRFYLDLELSSPRLKAYILLLAFCGINFFCGRLMSHHLRYTFLVWTSEHNTSTWKSGLSSVEMENLSKPSGFKFWDQQVHNSF